MAQAISIHPAVDHGISPAAKDFAGGILVCQCEDRPVKVRVQSQSAHNHACGCRQMLEAEGRLVHG